MATKKAAKTMANKTASAVSNGSAPVKIALVGFGTVGSSVAKVLSEQKFPGLQLTHIYNRDVKRKRKSDKAKYVPSNVIWTENFDEIINSDAQIVVELVGGLDPAENWLRKAFAAGKSVATANKQLIAYRGTELNQLAAKHGVQLM